MLYSESTKYLEFYLAHDFWLLKIVQINKIIY